METVEPIGIYVFGFPRSGHTAIMHWLGAQLLPDYSAELPEQEPCFGLGPSASYISMNAVQDKPDWELWLERIKPQYGDRHVCFVDDQRPNARPEVVCQNYETVLNAVRRRWLPLIVVLRDYYNNWASKWKKVQLHPQRAAGLKAMVKTWPLWAKEILSAKRLEWQVILYDRWLVCEDYRRELCQTLQLPFSDAYFDYVPWPGSSWPGGLDRTALRERYKQVPIDELQDAVTEEIAILNERLFGTSLAGEE